MESQSVLKGYYTVSQKTRHQTLGHNFTNNYPIFKIFSLADSVVNLQQIHVWIFHQVAGERICKIGEHLAKLWAKSLSVSYTPFTLHFCLKDADLAR